MGLGAGRRWRFAEARAVERAESSRILETACASDLGDRRRRAGEQLCSRELETPISEKRHRRTTVMLREALLEGAAAHAGELHEITHSNRPRRVGGEVLRRELDASWARRRRLRLEGGAVIVGLPEEHREHDGIDEASRDER